MTGTGDRIPGIPDNHDTDMGDNSVCGMPISTLPISVPFPLYYFISISLLIDFFKFVSRKPLAKTRSELLRMPYRPQSCVI
jgi:hypothetical protein